MLLGSEEHTPQARPMHVLPEAKGDDAEVLSPCVRSQNTRMSPSRFENAKKHTLSCSNVSSLGSLYVSFLPTFFSSAIKSRSLILPFRLVSLTSLGLLEYSRMLQEIHYPQTLTIAHTFHEHRYQLQGPSG